MNNLEQILKGWAMGYSATLEPKLKRCKYQVVSITKGQVYARIIDCVDVGIVTSRAFDFLENYKITGWKYAGELAGSEPIPKGQKFKTKFSDEVLIGIRSSKNRVWFKKYNIHDKRISLNKSEIEPIFN